jgi:hypothetical protein
MFVGHYAVAFAGKKVAPKISLGTLFIASQFLDLIWPLFLLLGIESVRIVPGATPFLRLDLHDFPLSHSLATVIIWSAAFGGLYYAVKHYGRGACLLGAAVFSHWLLDFFTHMPDLPVYPGSTKHLGLGLWNSFAATMIAEGLIFAGAIILYSRITEAVDRIGTYAFWSLVVLLALMYFGNAFGPPPPDEKSLAWTALGQWLFVPWMYWVDRHRRASTQRA